MEKLGRFSPKSVTVKSLGKPNQESTGMYKQNFFTNKSFRWFRRPKYIDSVQFRGTSPFIIFLLQFSKVFHQASSLKSISFIHLLENVFKKMGMKNLQ